MEILINNISNKNPNREIRYEDKVAYKAIIESIYKELNPKATIHIADKIKNLNATTSHTVDISILSKEADQEILTIVNIFPQLESINEEDVINFSKILSDIGAAKGVMISNADFTKSAKNLAPELGINLCSVQDAKSREWNKDIKIPVLLTEKGINLNSNFNIFFDKGDTIYKDMTKWLFSADFGSSTFTLIDKFTQLWDENLIPHEATSTQIINLDYSNLLVKPHPSQEWKKFDGEFKYSIQKNNYLKYFTPIEYKAIESQLTYDTSISSIDLKFSISPRDETWIQIKDADSFINRNKGVLLFFAEDIKNIDNFEYDLENFNLKKQ